MTENYSFHRITANTDQYWPASRRFVGCQSFSEITQNITDEFSRLRWQENSWQGGGRGRNPACSIIFQRRKLIQFFVNFIELNFGLIAFWTDHAQNFWEGFCDHPWWTLASLSDASFQCFLTVEKLMTHSTGWRPKTGLGHVCVKNVLHVTFPNAGRFQSYLSPSYSQQMYITKLSLKIPPHLKHVATLPCVICFWLKVANGPAFLRRCVRRGQSTSVNSRFTDVSRIITFPERRFPKKVARRNSDVHKKKSHDNLHRCDWRNNDHHGCLYTA